MKIKHIFLSVLIASSGFIFTACDNYLDEVPEASISPEVYFTEATHIQASADNLYSDILPSHGTGNTYGIYKDDATTDSPQSFYFHLVESGQCGNQQLEL